MKRFHRLAGVLGFLLLAGCGGGGDSNQNTIQDDKLLTRQLQTVQGKGYSITVIEPLPKDDWVTIKAMNNKGQLVGISRTRPFDPPSSGPWPYSAYHVVMVADGAITQLPLLTKGSNPSDTVINGINDAGVSVGISSASGVVQPTIWQNGTVKAFTGVTKATFNGDAGQITLFGISSSGAVLGGTDAVGDNPFLWKDGVVTRLSLPSLSNSYRPLAMTPGGVILGIGLKGKPQPGYVWQNGTVTLLEGGSNDCYITGVNDQGQVVGYANNHAVIWQNGAITDLTPQIASTNSFSYAYGINNQGDIVGSYYPSQGIRHGFLLRNGKLTDLNAFMPDSSWVVEDADMINDRGQILVTANSGPSLLLTPN